MGGGWLIILDVVILAAMGLLGLAATGGLPGGSAQAQAAAGSAAARLAPFAGIIGIIGIILGILNLLGLVRVLGLFSLIPVFLTVWIASAVVLILLGLLQAYPLIASMTGGSAGAANAVAKVKGIQRPLSLAAVILAVLHAALYILGMAGISL